MGDHLELRPPREDDLTIIEKLTQDPETTGEFAWFGWHDPLRWRRGWAENRLLGDVGGVLMVVRGDRPLGFVSWRRHQATVAAFYWEIGIAMLPGPAATATAPRRTACWPATCSRTAPRTASRPAPRRPTWPSAAPWRRPASPPRAVARAIGWRDGQWRDGITYSLLRTDPAPALTMNRHSPRPHHPRPNRTPRLYRLPIDRLPI